MANPPVIAQSTDPKVAAINGLNTGSGGFGVSGTCDKGEGVFGESVSGHGVHGASKMGRGVFGTSEASYGVIGTSQTDAGVAAVSQNFHAVYGNSHSSNNGGVFGVNDAGGWGVIGRSETNIGVSGESKSGRGVHGISETASGVFGQSKSGRAIEGWSETNYGVSGDSRTFAGVRGTSVEGTGTEGWSTNGTGVFAISQSGVAVHGKGGRLAGFFEGDVEVTGDIRLANADCAEDFDVSGAVKVEPGTVMVLGNEGALSESQQAYDKRVAGVISGAGDYKPGIVLDKRQIAGNRQPIALMGKVFCKVDAQFGAIEVGDLLTTSPTPGHAMKTSDPFMAFGAVIGKALRPLAEGQGLIPILIALQ